MLRINPFKKSSLVNQNSQSCADSIGSLHNHWQCILSLLQWTRWNGTMYHVQIQSIVPPPDLYIVMRSALCNFCYEVINITCKGYWSLLNPLIHHKIYSYGVDERIGLTLFWLTRFAIAKLVEYHLLIQSWKVGNSHSKRFNVIVRLFSMISCQKNDHCMQWQSIFEKW